MALGCLPRTRIRRPTRLEGKAIVVARFDAWGRKVLRLSPVPVTWQPERGVDNVKEGPMLCALCASGVAGWGAQPMPPGGVTESVLPPPGRPPLMACRNQGLATGFSIGGGEAPPQAPHPSGCATIPLRCRRKARR